MIDVAQCESHVVLDSYIDVDVDSSNAKGFEVPGPLDAAGTNELSLPGKLILANRGDADNNGISDFAQYTPVPAGTPFTPVSIKLPAAVSLTNVRLRFDYSLSDPAGVTNAGGVWAAAPTGLMRLWKKNSSAARSVPDDLVTNGCYNATDLSGWDAGHRTVLYLEGVSGGEGVLTVSMGPVGETGLPWTDAVMVTVVQISYTVDHICTNAVHASHVVQTQVSPSGILSGTNVLYELQRYAGAQGAACFDGNGSNVQYVAGGAGQLVLRGLAPSDSLTNMVLKARVGNLESMSARFTVFDQSLFTAQEGWPSTGMKAQTPFSQGNTNVLYVKEWTDGFIGSEFVLDGQADPQWTSNYWYAMVETNGDVADLDWFNATGPMPSDLWLILNPFYRSSREFTLVSWFDCDGDGLYTNTEPHRVIGVKVVEVVDLVLSNTASGVTVASTNRDGVATASNTLYLAEATNGMATMTLQSDWLPTNVPPDLLRWDIVDATNDAVAGAGWVPHAGSCSNTAVTVTWSNTGANAVREFKVRTWFDCDSNGQLSPDEPMRSAFVTVLKVESVKVARPWDVDWRDLQWGSVILKDHDLRVKCKVSPALTSLSPIVGQFSATIRRLWISSAGVTNVLAVYVVPITAANAVLNNFDEVRLTIPAADLLANSLVTFLEDGTEEYCSADASNLTSAPTGSGNRNDSDAFDAAQSVLGRMQRGIARSPGDITVAPPEGDLSQTFFKAAGVQYFDVDVGGTRSVIRQIQEQADIFYYSGHGSHDGGYLLGIGEPGEVSWGSQVSAGDVAPYWADIDTAIIAGCSVLDIGDYNWNFPLNNTSPGKQWATTGATWYLGYNAWAPSDSRNGNQNTTAAIVNSWKAKIIAGSDNEVAWKDANLAAVDPGGYCHGRNACVIHVPSSGGKSYSYFEALSESLWVSGGDIVL